MSTPFGAVILQRVFAKSETVQSIVSCAQLWQQDEWLSFIAIFQMTIDLGHCPLSPQSYSAAIFCSNSSYVGLSGLSPSARSHILQPSPAVTASAIDRNHSTATIQLRGNISLFPGFSHLLWREKLSVVCEKQKAGQVRYGLTRFADSVFRGIQS